MGKATYTGKSLGVPYEFSGPDNVEEIGRITGDPNACIKAFFQQYTFQDRNGQIRAKVCEAVETLTGIEREHVVKTNDAGEESKAYTETEQNFINRVKATGKLTDEDLTRLVLEANDEIGDWQPSSGRTSKPRKEFYAQADSVLSAIKSGRIGSDGEPASADKTVAKIEAFLGISFDASFGEFNRDNLARAFAAVQDKLQQQAMGVAL